VVPLQLNWDIKLGKMKILLGKKDDGGDGCGN
jgi:hypothetical protein